MAPGTSWRRGRDSNPRFRFPGTRAFQARPFNHSGTSPTIQVRDARRKKSLRRGSHRLAERAGFEPAIPESGIPVFETGAFNHSATSPSPKIISKAKMSLFMRRRMNRRSHGNTSNGCPVRRPWVMISPSRYRFISVANSILSADQVLKYPDGGYKLTTMLVIAIPALNPAIERGNQLLLIQCREGFRNFRSRAIPFGVTPLVKPPDLSSFPSLSK